MSNLAHQYTVPEVKTLLKECEGKGPGVGGHAISEHGHLRDDVTDRNKPKDTAFQKEVLIFGKRLVTPGVGGAPTQSVPPMDQVMVVTFALNSVKGQKKLGELDKKPDHGTFDTAIQTKMEGFRNVLPELRIAHHNAESVGTRHDLKVEIFKIDGKLHIHSAYAIA